MLKIKLLLPLTMVFGIFSQINLLQAQEAGLIRRLSGNAVIISPSNQSREAKVNDPVSVGDTISSAKESQVLIQLKDKSTMLVRSESKFKVIAFQFDDNKATDTLTAAVLSGTLRAVSGQIGKGQPDNVKYQVGTATIGIRGTDIEIGIVPEGQKDRAGIYNYVYAGETSMRLATGETSNIQKDLTGFSPDTLRPGESRLQILRDRPAFLQNGGLDTLMQQLTQPRIMVR